MYQNHLSQPYQAIKGMYDAHMNGNTTVGSYNQISGAIYEMKSSYQLPNSMYNQLNSFQNRAGQALGGLERKL